MRTIQTQAGKIEIISFNKFIKNKIKHLVTDKNIIQYNQLIGYGTSVAFEEDKIQESSYIKKSVFLHKNLISNHLLQILNDVKFIKTDATDNNYIVEDLVVECLMNFVEPEILVALGKRKYIAVSSYSAFLCVNQKENTSAIAVQSPIFGVTFPISKENKIKRWGKTELDLIKDLSTPDAKVWAQYIIKSNNIVGEQI